MKDSNEDCKTLLINLLQEMDENNIKPTIRTMNSVLRNISIFSHQQFSKVFALQIIADFRFINVEPSLASYYFLLLTFCRKSN